MGNELVLPSSAEDVALLEEAWMKLSIEERRERLELFVEEAMVRAEGSPYDYNENLIHWYGDKTYGREITIPKDVVMVGEIYKEPQLNIMLTGKVLVVTENIATVMTAPQVFTSDPGTFKIGRVLEEMRWVTVMGRDNEETDEKVIMDSHTVRR